MISKSDIYELLHKIVMEVTGVPIAIEADQNRPAPSGSYCAIRAKQNTRTHGRPEITRVYNDGLDTQTITVSQRKLTDCFVDFYRDNAQDYADQLVSASILPTVQAYLIKASIGWHSESAVQNLTTIVSSNYEQRARITVTMMYTDTRVISQNTIKSVEFSVIDEDRNKILDKTVNDVSPNP